MHRYIELQDSAQLQHAMSAVSSEIDSVLMKLDEFNGLVTKVQGDTEAFRADSVPALHATCARLRESYERISQLEVNLLCLLFCWLRDCDGDSF